MKLLPLIEQEDKKEKLLQVFLKKLFKMKFSIRWDFFRREETEYDSDPGGEYVEWGEKYYRTERVTEPLVGVLVRRVNNYDYMLNIYTRKPFDEDASAIASNSNDLTDVEYKIEEFAEKYFGLRIIAFHSDETFEQQDDPNKIKNPND